MRVTQKRQFRTLNRDHRFVTSVYMIPVFTGDFYRYESVYVPPDMNTSSNNLVVRIIHLFQSEMSLFADIAPQ